MLDQAPPPSRWELYRILGEPARLRLLALAAQEELAIGELAEILDESQPNVSRHAGALRQAGLLAVRKEGTRTFLRLSPRADGDPVVADALASGRALCEADGSLKRIEGVLAARESVAKEFFASAPEGGAVHVPPELAAYLSALAPLLPRRRLAVDVGTGDGGFLEVLAAVYDRVLAVDRSEAQLERARARVRDRGFSNVTLIAGEPDAPKVKAAVGEGADAVFAARFLHHAARPGVVVEELAALLAPGGALVVLDYEPHEDERLREQADVWLGFAPAELRRFASAAGLHDVQIARIPKERCGRGTDAHVPWQMMVARRPEAGVADTKVRDIAKRKPQSAAEGTRRK